MKIPFKLLLILVLTSTQIIYAQKSQDTNWKNLFNGKDLNNWIQRNGKADYSIEGNEIVGTSKMNTPNSFLCTKQNYGDFILEFDVKVDPKLNSGVQIRSLSKESYRNGRVHGYQVEIDPSPRAYSGGIYDEGRRAWLYPLSRNKAGREAFKNNEWNTYHVEAIGNTIRTWINGVQCANLLDDMTAEGFIALQVHAIYSEDKAGTQVRWKNLRIKTENLEATRWKIQENAPEFSYLNNQLTKNEKKQGWKLLFDGKTSKGWKSAKGEKFPEKGWKINNGVLIVEKSGGGESTNGGDIITTKSYSNFELILDFKITPGANSGIKYFVDPGLNKGAGSAIGLEFQILDNEKHPDAKKGKKGNRTVASLYDLIRAKGLQPSGKNKHFKGVGQWNRARIIVKGKNVEHWLNNEFQLSYERGGKEYRKIVAGSKYKDWKDFGELPEGPILLQDHGDEVHFRNIKIRELKK